MAAKNNELPINHNILNMITPTGLEFKKNSLRIGENFAKCLTVSKYPSNPEFGWLAKICQIEGTTASVEFHPTESGTLVERCNEQISQLRRDISDVKEESVRQNKEKAIEDISNMITRISINGEVVGYVNIILLVQANTEEKLDERIKVVTSLITTLGGSTRVLTPFQKEAFQSASPYGIPNEKLIDIGYRNMPLSTFMGGFANAASGINDGIGFLIGKSENGKPIIINTWKRGGDRTNTNWFITGVPGVGKSALAKFIFMLEYALGCKIIILDPEREFVDLTLNMGGKVINCSGGAGGRINPLQVRPAPKLEADEALEDEFFKDEGRGVSDLALHFQTLRTFIKLYKKDINEEEMAKLEEILENTYERFNITWETDIKKFKNNEFPIFKDLYDDILKEIKEDPDNKILMKLKSYFRSISIGADSFIWNGHTDIEADSDFIDLDISALLDADDNILRAQFHNINSWVWQLVAADRTERILYGIDEGYLIVDPENPQAISFVKNFTKRVRKYEGGLLFITHSVVDVLDPAVKRHGQAIIDSACFKFIMGTDGKNLQDTKELFNLTEAEESLLLSKQRGKGLLFAGSSRVAAQIIIPETFLNLMGKAGGR